MSSVIVVRHRQPLQVRSGHGAARLTTVSTSIAAMTMTSHRQYGRTSLTEKANTGELSWDADPQAPWDSSQRLISLCGTTPAC